MYKRCMDCIIYVWNEGGRWDIIGFDLILVSYN